MVRFAYGFEGGCIGFHEIPNRNGVPSQTAQQLGIPLSAGCVHQFTPDARLLWNRADVGTKVVVPKAWPTPPICIAAIGRRAKLGEMAGDQRGTPDEIVDTLTATWRALSDLGAGLTESQWKTPTDLPGWSVQDTLCHVIGTERLLEGLPSADPLPGELPPHVRNPIGEINEREIVARRSRTGTDVLAEWDEFRVAREATLEGADDDYFQQRTNTPIGPGTMIDFLAMRILDCWVHEQDIRRALDLSSTCHGAAATHTVDRLSRALPMVVGKRAACPEGQAVAVELTGPFERRLVCEVTKGRAAFVDTPSAPVLTTIAMDTDCFVLLATGRQTATEVADRVTVTGDADLAARVLAGMNVLF